MMKSRAWLGVLLALTLVLSACAGGDAATSETLADIAEYDGAEVAVEREAVGEVDAGTTDDGGAANALTDTAVTERKVIRTGQITVQADDTRSVMDQITTLVEGAGGYVASSQVNPTGEDRQPSITITIRVPADGLTNALASIRSMATEVVSESIQSQDVTEEYVDIESRLRNLNALETELLALLADVREQPDADPQKLLTVYNEVARVRGDIEVMEGRRRLLDNQASLSTITVSIQPTPVSEPIVDEGWQPLVTARQALGDLVEALQSLGDLAIWFAIFALPVLLIVALPVYVIVRIVRRRNARRRAATPVPTPQPEPAAVASGPADEDD
jgi:hypothetical protein